MNFIPASMPFTSVFVALVAAAVLHSSQVDAHGGVIGYTINGVYYPGFEAYATPAGQVSIERQWDAYDPILDPSDSFLACNIPGVSLGAGQRSATVPAGSEVVAYWNRWPHDIGPVMAYMARCPGSCAAATSTSLNWFKIAEEGLNSGTILEGDWGQKNLQANNNSWTTTIPPSLPAGEYMLRHELLAIHTPNQPQFYPNCAQLIITGNGKGVPSPMVKIPGAYSTQDPGVMINIYLDFEQRNYTIPGPPVWNK